MGAAAVVLRTLEAAAERECFTEDVYSRLFERDPEVEALFIRDRDGGVRAEMLAKVWEILIDVAERREWAARMIQCEVVTHEGYGVPPDVFGNFFDTVAETVREGALAWGSEEDRAWSDLLATVHRLSADPVQKRDAVFG